MWLETVLLIEAAAAFWLSALNVTLLARVVVMSQRPARRAAVVVLMCVCTGQAMEALLFLWLGDASSGAWPAVAVLVVRTALLVSTSLMSLLLTRALLPRR